MKFSHLMPTRILFGRGRLSELGVHAAPIGRRALLVTGRRSARASGLLQRTVDALRAAALEVHVFDGIAANPMSDDVDAAAQIARERACDLVVALGGGSVLDAAKAAAVAVHHASVRELIGKTLPEGSPALPIIAIPTTAGTGAEVTKGAIIQDAVTGFKSGVRGDSLFPRVAIIDPALSAGMPRELALETAFDAFTHAVESHVGRGSTPLTDPLSEQAVRLVWQNWRRACASPGDDTAHDALCLAALLGGLNVGNAGTCLPHRLQQAMAVVERIDAPHGRGLAALYPAWLRLAYPFAHERFDRLGAVLGLGAGALPDAITHWLAEMGLPSCLASLGFVAADVGMVVENVSGNVANDPVERIDASTLRSLFIDALAPPGSRAT